MNSLLPLHRLTLMFHFSYFCKYLFVLFSGGVSLSSVSGITLVCCSVSVSTSVSNMIINFFKNRIVTLF